MFFRKKFRWCRLFIWIGGLIFLVLVMAIAARLWLIPIAIKSEIESKIRRVWSGPVFVGPVRFTYDGHVQLEQITLQDSNERQRLQAESIHIVLEKWPTELKTISLDIDSLRIQVFLDNDSHFPKTSQSKSKLEKPKVGYSGIEKLKIKNISAAFYDSKETRVGYEGLNLSANRADGLYHIKLERVSENRPESFLLNGTFSPESRLCSLELDAHHRCTFDETAMLAKLLNLNSFYKAEGTMIADIDIKGDLRRLNYLSNNGNIKIKDVNVMRKEVLIFENMSSDIELGNTIHLR